MLGAVGLLVAGLARADPNLVWASIGASAVGGLAVVVAAIQRGKALPLAEPDDAAARATPAVESSVVRAVAADAGTTNGPAAAEDSEDSEPTGPTTAFAGEDDRASDAAEYEAIDPVDEPGEEAVDPADLLLIIDLSDEVLVVDLRPRYHRAACEHLDGREPVPLPVKEAREDGFTPCGLCRPDADLAGRARRLSSGSN